MLTEHAHFISVLAPKLLFFFIAGVLSLVSFIPLSTMTDPVADEHLLDYDEEDAEPEQQTNGDDTGADKKVAKGNYVSIHSSGFRDFLLKPELLRAIVDCGFEHPSEGKSRV